MTNSLFCIVLVDCLRYISVSALMSDKLKSRVSAWKPKGSVNLELILSLSKAGALIAIFLGTCGSYNGQCMYPGSCDGLLIGGLCPSTDKCCAPGDQYSIIFKHVNQEEGGMYLTG